MIGSLFGDPNLAVSVLWGPGGEEPDRPLRAMRRAPDEVANFGASRAVVPTLRIDLRVGDVPGIARFDLIRIGDVTYTVSTDPQRDREGLLLTVDLVPQ